MTTLRHRQLRSLLDAFVDGELEPGPAARVRSHLATCWWCSGDVQSARLIKAAMARRRSACASLPVARLRRLARQIDHT